MERRTVTGIAVAGALGVGGIAASDKAPVPTMPDQPAVTAEPHGVWSPSDLEDPIVVAPEDEHIKDLMNRQTDEKIPPETTTPSTLPPVMEDYPKPTHLEQPPEGAVPLGEDGRAILASHEPAGQDVPTTTDV